MRRLFTRKQPWCILRVLTWKIVCLLFVAVIKKRSLLFLNPLSVRAFFGLFFKKKLKIRLCNTQFLRNGSTNCFFRSQIIKKVQEKSFYCII